MMEEGCRKVGTTNEPNKTKQNKDTPLPSPPPPPPPRQKKTTPNNNNNNKTDATVPLSAASQLKKINQRKEKKIKLKLFSEISQSTDDNDLF